MSIGCAGWAVAVMATGLGVGMWIQDNGMTDSVNGTDIIANHLGYGPTTVTIRKGDAAFLSNRCGQWAKVGG